MNAIGFVSTLLIILAAFFATFQDSFFSAHKLQKSYIGYSEASRQAQNELSSAYYKSIRKKPAPKTDQGKPTSSLVAKKPLKQRKTEETPECARLNFSPLLSCKEPPKELYELSLRLLHTLYGGNLLAKEGLEKKLLDAIIAAAKAKDAPKPLHLAQLRLKDSSLQPLFYKILKGVRPQNRQQGTPSLLDYVTTEIGGQEKICLACASRPMLSALFGAKAAARLEELKEDEGEQLQVSKSKLEEILLKESPLSEKTLPLVHLAHKKEKGQAITVTGRDSGIQVKKKGHLSSSQRGKGDNKPGADADS